ncbi:hypothetical protein [Staphylococcus aureus]|uniref:hypothetical protein n=1 Tax=Staphylococcus aureus TaxID=1280 RepID=UPI0030F47849
MDIFKQLELIKQQNEREGAIRDAMLEILELGEVEEDEIPQNSNPGASIRVLIKNEKDAFLNIRKSQLLQS